MEFSADELEIIKAVKDKPSVSLILTIEPKIALKTEMQQKLKIASQSVKRSLLEKYPENISMLVFKKLEKAIASVDYEQIDTSIAIFVSPVISKTFYLDIPLEEKIIIDESFEVRDLVFAKQEALKYLVLLITGRHAKAFIADDGALINLDLGISDIETYENDIAERVFNFSDPSQRKETVQDKFLRHIDNALSKILRSNKLPVFLIGVDRLLGHFKSISDNTDNIIDTIHGNYEDATPEELKRLLKPYTASWKQQKSKELLNAVELAANAHKLDTGIQAVWESVHDRKGRLVIVEKDFIFPADFTADGKYISKHDPETTSSEFLKDAVDDIIEQVISYGGEVQFVESGVLNEFEHIVVIRYY